MMRTIVIATAVLLAAMAPLQAQTVRTVAVADFENISLDSGLIPTPLLSDVLAQYLQRQGGQVRVVAASSVRAAMRARGYTAEDLISPTKAAEIAQEVGAEWVVTGRWTQLRFVSRATPEPPSTRQGDALAIADVEIRVLEASSRRRVFEGRFSGRSVGGDFGSLFLAASEALRGAAAAIAGL